ncbi:MAG: hypothetical protein CL912_13470 [Deltaproteobacteria bacterium]|nr:hypothetical protein [Deltaproteobacteria bacterium]
MEPIDFEAIAPADRVEEYARSTRCRYVEILQYRDQAELVRNEDILDHESVSTCLSGTNGAVSQMTPSSRNNVQVQALGMQNIRLPSSGLRLL